MDGGLQKWRRERLQALADALGSKAELGRRLGYRDGAFVGQMISGLRPITEKTIEVAEAIRGPLGQSFKGWFAKDGGGALVAQEPGAVFEAPTASEMEVLDNFRRMHDHDRKEIAAEIAKRAAIAQTDIEIHLRRLGLTAKPASASAKAAATKERAEVPPTGQRELALEGRPRRRTDTK